MIYTPMTKLALTVSFQAHKEQKDKSGLPYVYHPFHLAEQMKDEDTTVAALLHDVVEDTGLTLGDLAGMGFGPAVLEALGLLTHSQDVPYLDYVRKIAQNPIARAVKIADLHHNSDLSRLETVTAADRARVENIIAHWKYLNNPPRNDPWADYDSKAILAHSSYIGAGDHVLRFKSAKTGTAHIGFLHRLFLRHAPHFSMHRNSNSHLNKPASVDQAYFPF